MLLTLAEININKAKEVMNKNNLFNELAFNETIFVMDPEMFPVKSPNGGN